VRRHRTFRRSGPADEIRRRLLTYEMSPRSAIDAELSMVSPHWEPSFKRVYAGLTPHLIYDRLGALSGLRVEKSSRATGTAARAPSS